MNTSLSAQHWHLWINYTINTNIFQSTKNVFSTLLGARIVILKCSVTYKILKCCGRVTEMTYICVMENM